MKICSTIILFITVVVQSKGQTFSEWFRQNTTQTKYLVEQIAALQVYADYLEKGYSIVHTGLSQIKNIKEGDIGLHADYFSSLRNINPTIKGYKRVNDIIDLKLEIESISSRVLKQIKTVKVINAVQRDYIGLVFKNLMEGCEEDVRLLVQLLSPNGFDLKDEERVKKIDELYKDMQEKYLFSRAFENKIKQLQLSKLVEQKEIEMMLKVFDSK